MHSSESGVTDHLAFSDEHAIVLARQAVANLNFRPVGLADNPPKQSQEQIEEPLYPAEDLYGIVSAELRRPFEMRDVISRVVDGSRLHEFKKEYGPTLVTGFGALRLLCWLNNRLTVKRLVCSKDSRLPSRHSMLA